MHSSVKEIRIHTLPNGFRIASFDQPGDIGAALIAAGFDKRTLKSTANGEMDVINTQDAERVMQALGINPSQCTKLGGTYIYTLR